MSRSELTDLAVRLAETIEPGPVRAAVVATTPAQFAGALDTLKSCLDEGIVQRLDDRAGVFLGSADREARVGVLFPGQASPSHLDGGAWHRRFDFVKDLYARSALPPNGDEVATDVAQPAIVTASLAGLKLLDGLGVGARIAVGHSLGELVALHWAEAWDEDALLRIAAARGKAMAQLGRGDGAMASIGAPRETVEGLFEGPAVVIAGLNSPSQTIVSGESAAVDAVVARARAVGLSATRLRVSHAFHSPLVAEATPVLARHLSGEQTNAPRRAVVSTVTGSPIAPSEDLRRLLERQITSPVRFAEALEAADGSVDLWIEVGPGSVLAGIVRELVATPVTSLDAGGESLAPLLRAVGTAFALGVPMNHRFLFEGRFARRFELDRQPKFFANPCELAPPPERAEPTAMPETADPDPPQADVAATNGRADAVPLEVVRKLVADRAELPVSTVHGDSGLLKDLHLSSLAVGQIVADAARALNLPPPAAPTDYADATVAQIAQALEEVARTGNTAAHHAEETVPGGVDRWIRAFSVDLIERPRTAAASSDSSSGAPGVWKIIAPAKHPLRGPLEKIFARPTVGYGVVLCLPAEPDARHVELMLEAAGAVLARDECSHFVVVQDGGGGAAFARTLHLERREIATCVVDVPAEHPQAAEWVRAEACCATGFHEVHYDESGTRREPVLRLLPPDELHEDAPLPLGASDVLLVTGGGKGIAAECALAVARSTGARLALVGRSDPAEDQELAANLERMGAAEVRFEYHRADVTDRRAVELAVRRFEAHLGPVTALLHGAGTNVPRLLGDLDRDAFLATLAPKIEGARNVLAAVDPQRLRLFVSFGSIIARTGMRGEADYAVANEWLAALTQRWGDDHPSCRTLAVEWSIWSGVGMGERLGRVDLLEQLGVTPITPDDGVRELLGLMGRASPTSAVVVAGRFGRPPTVELDEAYLPLWRFLERPRVHVPGVELVVDAELSADTDPYVSDHVFDGLSLFPAVMGLEAMAQAAMALAGSARPPVFEDVAFEQPVVVPADGTTTLRVAALVRAAGCVEVVLRSEETSFQVDHFRATCRFDDGPALLRGREKRVDRATATLSLDPGRDLYGNILFHRGRFQRLDRYLRLRATECVAQIAADGVVEWFGRYLPRPLVLGDCGMRDAAIHAIQACIPHATILPIGVQRIVAGVGNPTEPCSMRAREVSDDGNELVYDVELVGPEGDVFERWERLRLRRVREAMPPHGWVAPLLAPYLERRLGELVSGSSVSVAVERNGVERRSDRSRLAIDRVLGRGGVGRRGVGRGGHDASAARRQAGSFGRPRRFRDPC